MENDHHYTNPVAIKRDTTDHKQDQRKPEPWPDPLEGEVVEEYVIGLKMDCPCEIVHFSFHPGVIVSAPKALMPTASTLVGNEQKLYFPRRLRLLLSSSQADAIRRRAKLTPIYRPPCTRWIDNPDGSREPKYFEEFHGFASEFLILEPVAGSRVESLPPQKIEKSDVDLKTQAENALYGIQTEKYSPGKSPCGALNSKGKPCKFPANESGYCAHHEKNHMRVDVEPRYGDQKTD